VASLAGIGAGLVVTVLPFTYDTSPAGVIAETTTKLLARDDGSGGGGFIDLHGLWLIAAPFFLAYPLFVWNIRLMLARRIRRYERGLLLTLGLLGAAAVLGLVIPALPDASNGTDWAAFLSALGVLCVGVIAVVVLTVRRRDPDARVTAALAAPYAAILALCLIGFADDPEAGWYLALLPACAAAAELAAALAAGLKRRGGGGRATLVGPVCD
jgi:peptidoglycan/LPS O-acetylase OafA/YrhL